MTLDLYAILTDSSSVDAEPPPAEHITTKVACSCGRRLALVVGQSCWLVGEKLTKTATAEALIDAALVDFEELADAVDSSDSSALDVANFIAAANPQGQGLDLLRNTVPPLKLPARWVDITGLKDVSIEMRTNVHSSCARCGTLYRLEPILRNGQGGLLVARDGDWISRHRGFKWPASAIGSRTALYRHLYDMLLQ